MGECSNCGAEVPDVARYCPECGSQIESGPNDSSDVANTDIDRLEERGEQDSAGPDHESVAKPDEGATDEDDGKGAGEDEGTGTSITVSKILGYGVGLLFILAGLGALVMSFLSALLYLLTGLFAVPAVRDKIKDEFGITFSKYVVGAVIVVGMVAGGMAMPAGDYTAGPSTSNPGQTQASSGVVNTATESGTYHEPQESFVVGSGEKAVRYEVARTGTTDTLGSGFTTVNADGVFIVVQIRMTNVGKSTVDITSNHLRLVNEDGQEYETDSDALMASEDTIVFEQLDPGVTKEGLLIYDVPDNVSKGYNLKVDPLGLFSAADTHYVGLGKTSR